MIGRSRQILSRLPSHLEAARPGKQLETVTDALAGGLDLLATELAAVRRAHRLGHADTLRDVQRLAAMHGFGPPDFELLLARTARARGLALALETAAGSSPADREAAAEALFALWGIEAGLDRLALFAPPSAGGGAPDLDAAARELASVILGLTRYPAVVTAARTRVATWCAIHAAGNATVRALLQGAANALDLEIDAGANAAARQRVLEAGSGTVNPAVQDEFIHSTDLFWHATFVRDRAPLVRRLAGPPPANPVVMGASIAAAELADRMRLRFGDILPQFETLGLPAPAPSTPVDFATADRLATALHFDLERAPRGIVRLTESIGVADLARELGITLAELSARAGAVLRAVDRVDARTAAGIARKYGFAIDDYLPTNLEALGIEENPLREERYPASGPEPCGHGHRFHVVRRGFGRELMQIEVTGLASGTFGSMLVNRDEGRGIGFFGTVPQGTTLVMDESGRVFLADSDVTASAFSWEGACFADAEELDTVTGKPDPDDFVFAGPGVPTRRSAVFVRETPPGSLDRDFVFPHAGNDVVVPGIGLGVTRFAFFDQQARLSSREGEPATVRRVTPHATIGFADQSVFAAGPEPEPPVAEVTLKWMEHEAYAVRVILPQRFALLDHGGEPAIAAKVARALRRHQPAGVEVRVEYADDRWVLGRGFAVAGDTEDPNLLLRGGTVLWPAPADDT